MDVENPSLTNAQIAEIARRIDRPIVLVGLMGVGKSTVGRRLAALTGANFTDSDDEIEAASQRSISEIFEEFGEPYFRDGERRVIARLLDEQSNVIATGGGAFICDETRELILQKAIAVWIKSDLATLVERTRRKNTRPLLKNGDPEEIIGRLLEERTPYYQQAQIHVSSGNGPHDQAARRILEAIDQWL